MDFGKISHDTVQKLMKEIADQTWLVQDKYAVMFFPNPCEKTGAGLFRTELSSDCYKLRSEECHKN